MNTATTSNFKSGARLETCPFKVPTLHPPLAICQPRPDASLQPQLRSSTSSPGSTGFPVARASPLFQDLGSERSHQQ